MRVVETEIKIILHAPVLLASYYVLSLPVALSFVNFSVPFWVWDRSICIFLFHIMYLPAFNTIHSALLFAVISCLICLCLSSSLIKLSDINKQSGARYISLTFFHGARENATHYYTYAYCINFCHRVDFFLLPLWKSLAVTHKKQCAIVAREPRPPLFWCFCGARSHFKHEAQHKSTMHMHCAL